MTRTRRVAASLLLVGELFLERVAAFVAETVRLATLPHYPRLLLGGARRLGAFRLHAAAGVAAVAAGYLLAHVGA